MSFEKYAALVSTTAEKTRVSGSQIGNAFKTIFSRISRSKDGLTTDAEMSDAEAALKSVGVSVRRADNLLCRVALNIHYVRDEPARLPQISEKLAFTQVARLINAERLPLQLPHPKHPT